MARARHGTNVLVRTCSTTPATGQGDSRVLLGEDGHQPRSRGRGDHQVNTTKPHPTAALSVSPRNPKQAPIQLPKPPLPRAVSTQSAICHLPRRCPRRCGGLAAAAARSGMSGVDHRSSQEDSGPVDCPLQGQGMDDGRVRTPGGDQLFHFGLAAARTCRSSGRVMTRRRRARCGGGSWRAKHAAY